METLHQESVDILWKAEDGSRARFVISVLRRTTVNWHLHKHIKIPTTARSSDVRRT